MMMTLVIAAAAAAPQPATSNPSNMQMQHAQHESGKPAEHKDMDCCKDCCKDMAKKHEGRTAQ
jgi:hypothetical protein